MTALMGPPGLIEQPRPKSAMRARGYQTAPQCLVDGATAASVARRDGGRGCAGAVVQSQP